MTFESDRMDDAAYTEEDEEHAANGSQVQIYDMLAYWRGWVVFILESADGLLVKCCVSNSSNSIQVI